MNFGNLLLGRVYNDIRVKSVRGDIKLVLQNQQGYGDEIAINDGAKIYIFEYSLIENVIILLILTVIWSIRY